MNIVESIGKWGVKTTPEQQAHTRMSTPKPGDIIEFTDTEYPHTSGKYGRIEGMGIWKEGEFHICCHLGSAFLSENGRVSISGGPFESVKPDDLEPTFKLKYAEYWNWGNNLPGANQGVHYKIARPVFKLIKKINI